MDFLRKLFGGKRSVAETSESPLAPDLDEFSVKQMLFFKLEEDLREYIIADIKKFSPDRILVAGGGTGFNSTFVEQLGDLAAQYVLFRNENPPSLSRLCQMVEEIRKKRRKAILLSNYPRETDPPTTYFKDSTRVVSPAMPGSGQRTVKMPTGTSLRLCDANDTKTRVAGYVVGMHAKGYYDNFHRSQASGRENLTRIQFLVSSGDNQVYTAVMQELLSCSDAADCQRILEDYSNDIENDPGWRVVGYSGGILIE
jgi:hypothetical protein